MNIHGPVPQTTSIPPGLDPAARATAARARAAGPPAPAEPTSAAQTPSESSLWEILTPEEREFFEEQAAMGPLTYRPARPRASQAAAPTGQRIDVKG